MKYFITGVNGFVAKNLLKGLLLKESCEIVRYSSNVCKPIKIKNDFDIIYHLAANTDTTCPDDIEMYRNNILGFLNVLDFALKGKSKLIYASSNAIFGNGHGPLNAYGHSKLLIDQIAESFYGKLKIVGLRFTNVYGSYETQKGKMASMITQWRKQILDGKRPVIFNGEFRRDFVYVKDVIRALIQAQGLKNGIYDVGNGIATDFRDVLKIIIKILDKKVEPKFIDNPYLGKYQVYTKANLDWGFKPKHTLEQGIKDYYGNFK